MMYVGRIRRVDLVERMSNVEKQCSHGNHQQRNYKCSSMELLARRGEALFCSGLGTLEMRRRMPSCWQLSDSWPTLVIDRTSMSAALHVHTSTSRLSHVPTS